MDTDSWNFYELKSMSVDGEKVEWKDGYAHILIEDTSGSNNWCMKMVTKEFPFKNKKDKYFLEAVDVDGAKYQGELKLKTIKGLNHETGEYTLEGVSELKIPPYFRTK